MELFFSQILKQWLHFSFDLEPGKQAQATDPPDEQKWVTSMSVQCSVSNQLKIQHHFG